MWRPAILQKAETVLLDEKAEKLKGLAQLLDDALGDGFDGWADRAGAAPDAPAPVRLRLLQQALRPLVDRLTSAFPHVGLGYYDRRLDRIVAYGPSQTLGYLEGVTPPHDHLGRMAMERQAVQLAVGSMVRGDAMNCMRPLIRNDQVIGFAFANESVEDIYRQIQSGEGRSAHSAEISALFGLASLTPFAGASAFSAQQIRGQLSAAVAQGLVTEGAARPLTHALSQVERYTRLFLDNLSTGVVLVDDAEQIVLCNTAMDRLFPGDCRRGETTWPELMQGLGLQVEGELPSAGGQQTLRGKMAVAGRETEVELIITALPGMPGHRLCLLEDTEQSSQESSYFERAERLALAGELATSIAHEIRNPLTVVAGSIQLIPDRLDDREFLLSLSRIAGQELSRVNRIIQGLLGFARYAEPARDSVDLNGLIREAVDFLDWYARKHSVQVERALWPDELMVAGDREHLRQALLNLMMNGIQAMVQGGTLTIRTEHPAGSRSARIAIQDEGAGMTAEELAKVWNVFYSSKPGGTGLGLPVVQRIIDEHRGYIEVRSAPGAGSCFTISLPLINRANLVSEEEGA